MAEGRSARCLAGGRDMPPHEKWRIYRMLCVVWLVCCTTEEMKETVSWSVHTPQTDTYVGVTSLGSGGTLHIC